MIAGKDDPSTAQKGQRDFGRTVHNERTGKLKPDPSGLDFF
jgi:hypothetical protein